MTGGTGTGAPRGGLPREWAEIAQATEELRRRAARAIAVHGVGGPGPREGGAGVRMVARDAHATREALGALEPLATRSVWTLAPGGADPRALEQAATERSSARGIDLRLVLDLRARAAPLAIPHAQRGDLTVLLAPVSMQLILIDERLALVPGPLLDARRGPSCWLFSEDTVVEAARHLWRTTERHAAPLPAEVVVLTERQVAISRLLLEGGTDAAIARELGISVRTVASEVRLLMDAVGATSRYQTAMRLFQR
jgi:DNA-binding CsgD family transcriptional regulator